MATIAAVASAAVVAGAAAYSASQAASAGGGGGGGSGVEAPGAAERLFNRGTHDILDEERAVLEDALHQGDLIAPEMYRALGLEPVYDRPEDPELSQLSEQSNALADQLNVLQIEKANLNSQRGKGQKGRQKRLNQIKREIKKIRKTEAAVNDALGRKSTTPRRIVGFNKIPGVADPTGSEGGAFGGALNQFNDHLSAALAGKEPIDPTLKTAFDEKEQALRERLRRHMGQDYETSSAGIEALRNFDRERSEAFALYNRKAIDDYARLGESRAAALSGLTNARLRNLQVPIAARIAQAQALEGAATARMSPAELRQQERALRRRGEGGGGMSGNEAAIAALLQGAGPAIETAGQIDYGAALAGTAGAQPGATNVPVGGEFDTRGLVGSGGRLGGGGYLSPSLT